MSELLIVTQDEDLQVAVLGHMFIPRPIDPSSQNYIVPLSKQLIHEFVKRIAKGLVGDGFDPFHSRFN